MELIATYRDERDPLLTLLALIREARFAHGLRCPRCGATRVHRWGGFSGRQRYRCRGRCGRTFSDLTGTPAAHVKKLRAWLEYTDAMTAAISLRTASARLGIHLSTAFRWRHRLLTSLRELDKDRLSGSIEVRAPWFVESQKGSRTLSRPARTHKARYHWRCGVARHRVVVCCDRLGGVVSIALRGESLGLEEIEAAFGGRFMGRPLIVVRQGPHASWRRFASLRGGRFVDARSLGVIAPGIRTSHPGTAWTYCRRLRAWLIPFRGVATRYLPNYLVWHRRIDEAFRNRFAMRVLRWPLGP